VYAPWCEHSNRMAPAYRELASALASDSTVLVAKMRCVTNTWKRRVYSNIPPPPPDC
jgi:hypothetical protein